MPLEERKYKDINQFGEGDQAKVCVDIMHKTGAHLELSMAKDQGLSIMVSGKLDAVMKARKEIVSRLQTQVNKALSLFMLIVPNVLYSSVMGLGNVPILIYQCLYAIIAHP